MQILQKKGSNKHTFQFKEEVFNFAYEDKSGSGDADIPYSDLPTKSSVLIERNEWLRNVGILWVALGCFQLVTAIYTSAPLTGKGFWILLGAVCLAWFQFTKVRYSVYKTDQGNVMVIHGKTHDEVVNELMTRRKAQMLRLYGDVNVESEPAREMAKFRWLVEQGVLSPQEAEVKIAQLEAATSAVSSSSGVKLN